jgi:oligopeptide/dipeptide ABC transporter ATP-binding protein
MNLIEVSGLRLAFMTERGRLDLFTSLNLSLGEREILAIVGESGSGKSTLAYAIVRLLPGNAGIVGGDIRFEGKSLIALKESEMAKIRGKKVTMVFQDPGTSLNPVFRVGEQMLRVIRNNIGLEGVPARRHAAQLLKDVELADTDQIMDSFPFELSGGMQQRVMLAMALSSNPRLIIADEPTSAVDATIQMQILRLLQKVKSEREFSMILITHSIAVAQDVSDRIAVMYAGDIVEEGDAKSVVRSPKHPYTQALVRCIPQPRGPVDSKVPLPVVGGQVPDLTMPPQGCRFHPRCPYAMDICRKEKPPYYSVDGSRALCFLYKEGVERS